MPASVSRHVMIGRDADVKRWQALAAVSRCSCVCIRLDASARTASLASVSQANGAT